LRIRSLIANLTPHGHALDAYYRIMAENGTLVDILPRTVVLLDMGIVFFLIAVWRFRFE
jgi:hypothetical protein